MPDNEALRTFSRSLWLKSCTQVTKTQHNINNGNSQEILHSEMSLPRSEVLIEKLLPKDLVLHDCISLAHICHSLMMALILAELLE